MTKNLNMKLYCYESDVSLGTKQLFLTPDNPEVPTSFTGLSTQRNFIIGTPQDTGAVPPVFPTEAAAISYFQSTLVGEVVANVNNNLDAPGVYVAGDVDIVQGRQPAIADPSGTAGTNAPNDAVTNYNVITTLLGSLTGAVNAASTKQNAIADIVNTNGGITNDHKVKITALISACEAAGIIIKV